jgi:hypothetical protein
MGRNYVHARPRFTSLLVKQYTPMVAKLCWRYWASLPPSIRVWLDIEDLLIETLTHIGGVCLPLYNRKSSSVTTFVYMNAERHLINIVKKYNCAKRGAIVVSVEPASLPTEDPLRLSSLYETRMVLEKVYTLASAELKVQMRQWFCPPAIRETRIKKTRDFRKCKEEFIRLADECALTRHDCQSLLQTGYDLSCRI